MTAMQDAERSLRDAETLSPAMSARVLERLAPTVRELTRAKPAPRRFGWRWVWVPVALTAAIAGVVAMPWRLPLDGRPRADVGVTPVIAGLAGHATAQSAAGVETLAVTASLRDGAVLTTDAHARVALDVNSATRVTLDEQSDAVLVALAQHRTVLQLRRGLLAGRLNRAHEDSRSIRIETIFGRVEVLGTVFAVHLSATELQVEVVQGEVSVATPAQGELRVAAQQCLTVRADGHATQPLLPAASANIERLLEPTAWRPTAVVEPARPPESDAVQQLMTVPAKPKASPSRPKPAVAAADTDLWESLVATSVARGDCQTARAALPLQLRTPANDAAAEALVAIAECFDAQGQPELALQSYAQAAREQPETALGQSAGFDAGRIALKLKRPTVARAAFDQLVHEHPTHPLANEAAFRVCTATMEMGEADEALACFAQFRSERPAHRRVRDCHFLEATLWRTAKADCGRAMVAYQAYLADPGELAEQAQRWLQDCQGRERSR